MDTTITQGNQNVPEASTTANSGEKVLTAFDKWVTGPVAKTVKKHIKPSDFNQNKLNIEVKVNGYNEGTFQIIVDKTKPDKHEQIAVNPYDYKDYDVHLEGDTSTILELLNKHTVLNEEIHNKTIIAKAKKVHGDKYDYSKSEYINIDTPICIICHEKDENGNEHGEFWVTPNKHIHRKQGCAKCSGNKKKTTEKPTTEKGSKSRISYF